MHLKLMTWSPISQSANHNHRNKQSPSRMERWAVPFLMEQEKQTKFSCQQEIRDELQCFVLYIWHTRRVWNVVDSAWRTNSVHQGIWLRSRDFSEPPHLMSLASIESPFSALHARMGSLHRRPVYLQRHAPMSARVPQCRCRREVLRAQPHKSDCIHIPLIAFHD